MSRLRNAQARYRRDAIRAQQAAASAYAWMRGRCDWPNAPRYDLLCDQAYVAKRYEQARAAVNNLACMEHRE